MSRRARTLAAAALLAMLLAQARPAIAQPALDYLTPDEVGPGLELVDTPTDEASVFAVHRAVYERLDTNSLAPGPGIVGVDAFVARAALPAAVREGLIAAYTASLDATFDLFTFPGPPLEREARWLVALPRGESPTVGYVVIFPVATGPVGIYAFGRDDLLAVEEVARLAQIVGHRLG